MQKTITIEEINQIGTKTRSTNIYLAAQIRAMTINIKITAEAKIFIKTIASAIIAYAFFEKRHLFVSVALGFLLIITLFLRKDKKIDKNRRTMERISDIFVFTGACFFSITNITISVGSFLVIVILGYIPFLWSKKSHSMRLVVILAANTAYFLGQLNALDFGLLLSILITARNSIKNFSYVKNKLLKYTQTTKHMKQAIIVRHDLNLSKGKMSAQVAHASVSAYKKAEEKDAEMWELEGQKKVILKIAGEKELLEIFMNAKKEKIPCALIKDAGRTEIPEGTITCAGLGPSDSDKIDKVAGHLKLY